MHQDPIGEMCEEILETLTYIAKLSELSMHSLYIKTRYGTTKLYLAAYSIFVSVRFFIGSAWNYLFWKYIYEALYIFGLKPALTDEDIARAHERLRQKIADTQYDHDPRVLASKAKAQALLDAYDSSK